MPTLTATWQALADRLMSRPMKPVSSIIVFITFTLSTFLLPFAANAHSAIEPAPRIDRGWTNRQVILNKRAAEAGEKAEVIFIGDSITEGWEKEGKEVWE